MPEEVDEFVIEFESWVNWGFDYVIERHELVFHSLEDLSDARREIVSRESYSEKNGRRTVNYGEYDIFVGSLECFRRVKYSIDSFFKK